PCTRDSTAAGRTRDIDGTGGRVLADWGVVGRWRRRRGLGRAALGRAARGLGGDAGERNVDRRGRGGLGAGRDLDAIEIRGTDLHIALAGGVAEHPLVTLALGLPGQEKGAVASLE